MNIQVIALLLLCGVSGVKIVNKASQVGIDDSSEGHFFATVSPDFFSTVNSTLSVAIRSTYFFIEIHLHSFIHFDKIYELLYERFLFELMH